MDFKEFQIEMTNTLKDNYLINDTLHLLYDVLIDNKCKSFTVKQKSIYWLWLYYQKNKDINIVLNIANCSDNLKRIKEALYKHIKLNNYDVDITLLIH